MTDATVPNQTAATTWMGTMVNSLADNKAALGRRYAEWAVSAPTLESAVGAAAMAQDELGHARSTYPVLKALGIEVEETRFGGGHKFAVLDQEFPSWPAFIAANLVVDGTLATFVFACESSSVTQMSQRAKKILQEEGSHRVHAEAWTRRICSQGGPDLVLLVEAVQRCWAEASMWLGPHREAGAAQALDEGMINRDAAGQRELMRTWLVELFASGGVNVDLPNPEQWSNWNPQLRRIG